MQRHRILIVVSGGIAAYKVPELVRRFRRSGHAVRCVMTRAASHFVAPLVLQTLSGEAVRSQLFDPAAEAEIDHIELADWADIVVVAPATANLMAKCAGGLADDLPSTLLLATRAPVLMSPAMNVNMWDHPATQANVATLRSRGLHFVGPDSGELACGWEGEGRMAEPEAIALAAEAVLGPQSLLGHKILVTAGGTREPIDPVRSLANHSSGRMGFAVAAEAARRGGEVVLVTGPTSLETPSGVRRIDVSTALEMRDAVLGEFEDAAVVVKAAAVADFRPAEFRPHKLKKEDLPEGGGMRLELVPNPDILAELGQRKGDRVIIGFAAESRDVIAAARRKLQRKGCDLMVANDVSRSDAGFAVADNAVSFVWPDGQVDELPLLPKSEVAAQIFDRVEKLLARRSSR